MGFSGVSPGLGDDVTVLFQYLPGDSIATATYSRASTAVYTDASGILQTAASGAIRDAHYVNGARTTLLEGARTNLQLRSEEFDNAAWAKTNVTVTANAIAAPDGLGTADKIVEDTATSAHYINRATTVTNATPHVISFFAKPAGRDWFCVGVAGAGSGDTYFNVATGTIGNVVSGGSAEITALANGWYRCILKVTSTATTLTVYPQPKTANGGGAYLGDGTSGVYIWGAQLESGATVSSYIPTTVSSVTRSGDSLSFPFPHAPQEMSAYVRFTDRGATGATMRLVHIGGPVASSAPRLSLARAVSGGYVLLHQNSASRTATSNVSPANSTSVELVGQLAANGTPTIHAATDGGAVTTATSTADALAAAWSSPIMHVMSHGGTEPAFAAVRDIIIVNGTRDMSWFRGRVQP